MKEFDARVKPRNTDAEQAVLGSMFMKDAAIVDVAATLSEDDFYDPRNQAIYRVMLSTHEAGRPIDPMVVINELDRLGILEKSGGPAYVTGTLDYVITPENVLYHAEIVKEKSQLRSTIDVAEHISEEAIKETDESEVILQKAEAQIFSLMSVSDKGEFRRISEDTEEVREEVFERIKNKGKMTGVTSGIRGIDDLTGGWQKSDLIILAARPSVGKTSMALNMAVAAAKSSHKASVDVAGSPAVAIFSLEMSRNQLIQRLACTEARIRGDHLRRNMLSDSDVVKFSKELTRMNDLEIHINDSSSLTPAQLRMHSRRVKTKCPNLSLIIVDYLQLMSSDRRIDNRQQEVSEISRALKGVARDLNVPVIALSQLSRNIESRKGEEARPRLSDLRESGAIEQDADVVSFIHRSMDRDEDSASNPGESVLLTELIICKQRNGPVGSVDMLFNESYTLFTGATPNVNVPEFYLQGGSSGSNS